MSIQRVIRELRKDAVTYRCPGGSIILSDGESLMQYEFASELLRAHEGQGRNTTIETIRAGNHEAIEKVIPYVDAVLLDIKHMGGEQHRKLTGVSNDLVIRNIPEICKIPNTVIHAPVIPDFDYSVKDIKAIVEFARTLVGIRTIHLLPYHPFGENKYSLLGQDYTLKQVKPLAPEDLEECKTVIESYGFQYIIGG